MFHVGYYKTGKQDILFIIFHLKKTKQNWYNWLAVINDLDTKAHVYDTYHVL